ncbi:DUF2663 family protein [Paenibacillus methanolicus]|uniref:Uncharacterized protein DUF2663 n=1 Tax=Paenibacillus methanolicus TaxID=582686 RepID=A0A5S5C379_9BACL|nr:DUF2663 family protein [Paenibacillus methanolicus]TYP73767.1 uncharacterized protein DUF2663 [Paenibacillus methanolicus]
MRTVAEQIDELPISADAKGVLKEVVKRKEKVDGLKRRQTLLAIVNGGVAVVLLFWLYKLSRVSSSNVFDILNYLGGSTAATLFLLVAISSFLYAGSVSKEYKKEKQKYDDLRQEAITYLRAKWDVTEESMLRDKISTILSKRDINLVFYS